MNWMLGQIKAKGQVYVIVGLLVIIICLTIANYFVYLNDVNNPVDFALEKRALSMCQRAIVKATIHPPPRIGTYEYGPTARFPDGPNGAGNPNYGRKPDASAYLLGGVPLASAVKPILLNKPIYKVERLRQTLFAKGCSGSSFIALYTSSQAPVGTPNSTTAELDDRKVGLRTTYSEGHSFVFQANLDGCRDSGPPQPLNLLERATVITEFPTLGQKASWVSFVPLPDCEIDYYSQGRWIGTSALWAESFRKPSALEFVTWQGRAVYSRKLVKIEGK